MKPVYQVPNDGRCMDACIASLFHLTLDDVNTYCAGMYHDAEAKAFRCSNSDHEERWGEGKNERVSYKCLRMDYHNASIEAWANERGLTMTCISVSHAPGERQPGLYNHWPLPPGLCIAGGKAERGYSHVVVWDTRLRDAERPWGRMVHDPHPSGVGLERVEEFYWFEVIDPSKVEPRIAG